MNNPLYDELLNLRYIPISAIDEELPPESVVLYFKNLSQLDKRISVEPIHGVQLDLQSQNPTIELEDYKATFCLGPSPYIPIVTINPISDFTDPSYPLTVTITGTITRTDNYIPNEIVVNYNNQNKRATLVNDTEWSVTFDLRVVSQNLTEYVTAKANSIDVNSSVISGYSEIVTSEFNIIFYCTVPSSTLSLKAANNLVGKEIVYEVLIEDGFNPPVPEIKTLLFESDLSNPTATTGYNIDYSINLCEALVQQLGEYSQISFDTGTTEEFIVPFNNCVDNIGDCEFELRINGFQTITNNVELILTEDDGSTYIKVQSPPSGNNRDTILTNLAAQLSSHGYTVVTSASNSKIKLRKNSVSSLRVITNGYGIYSFSVNSFDWDYLGTLNVDGVSRENVGVRPLSCTLGIKDPHRNFATTTMRFEGWPLKDPNVVNHVSVTITPVTDLGPNQLDFLTTFTNVSSFVFESCDTNIRSPE